MSEWKVYTKYNDYAHECDIYIFRELTDCRELITKIENGNITIERFQNNSLIPNPTMTLRGEFTKPFLQAFADLCFKEGIMPEKQPVIENELTATKYHLEDMRKLMKIK